MDFRNYIPPDGGHVGCGIWQRLAPQNNNNLNSKHEPLRRRVVQKRTSITQVSL